MGMPVITPGTITRGESVGNIIESIATQEAAIAHILNAESEKLQRIIDSDNVDVTNLLDANQSVKNAVDTVIGLELALKAKLQIFKRVICQID